MLDGYVPDDRPTTIGRDLLTRYTVPVRFGNVFGT